MEITLMADEVERLSSDISTLSRALGRVEASIDEAKVQNVEIKDHLRRQDERSEINKDLAIKAREASQAEIKTELGNIRDLNMETREIAIDNRRWIDEQGKPGLADHHRRLSELEGRNFKADNQAAVKNGEKRGAWRVWGLLGSVVTGLLGLVGWLGWDALSPVLTRLLAALARHQ